MTRLHNITTYLQTKTPGPITTPVYLDRGNITVLMSHLDSETGVCVLSYVVIVDQTQLGLGQQLGPYLKTQTPVPLSR